MKTDARTFILGISLFVLLTDFLMDFLEYNSFTLTQSFPNVANYLSVGAAWTTASNDLGGNWAFLGFSLAFIKNFFIGILFIPAFLYNLVSYIFNVISFVISFITYPFAQLPSPFNTLFDLAFGLSLAIVLVFSIRTFIGSLSGGND